MENVQNGIFNIYIVINLYLDSRHDKIWRKRLPSYVRSVWSKRLIWKI